MTKTVWQLPLKTVSEANSNEHWAVSSKRHRQQQFFVRKLFHDKRTETPIPCVITLTRLSPRGLDDDNLGMAFKWIRDEISECLLPDLLKTYIDKAGKVRKLKGRADSDPRIKWVYAQEKQSITGVRIEIEQAIKLP